MSYNQYLASTNKYGTVKVGSGITVNNGVISVNNSGLITTGTWTPTIAVSTAGTITLTINNATYAKMGKQVICYYDIVAATRTGGANASTLTLNGLPFTSTAGTGQVGGLVTTYFENMNDNQTSITGSIAGSSNSVLLWKVHEATSMSRLTYADIRATAPLSRLVGTITYLSAT